MKISVIIPTIDEQPHIEDAIRSAWNAGADEIIVADGGSIDRTVSLASSLGARAFSSRSGRAVQQNAGAEAASGDVFVFLHADCRLDADSLAQIRAALQNKPRCVGGCFRQSIADDRFRYRLVERGNILRVRILKWIYGDQALFVRRDVFECLGGFPNLRLLEDLYFAKSLRAKGKLIVLVAPLVVSARRWNKVGLVKQTVRNWAIITAAHLGVSPERLAKFYPRAR